MKKISINANPHDKNPKKQFSQGIVVILPDDLPDGYAAEGKDFPDGLPDTWFDPEDKKTKNIDWISNFGLTYGGQAATALPAGKKYKIQMPRSAKKYVYYDGSIVKKLNTRDAGVDTLEADLTEADPPIGMT